jgi:hypothetical protein
LKALTKKVFCFQLPQLKEKSMLIAGCRIAGAGSYNAALCLNSLACGWEEEMFNSYRRLSEILFILSLIDSVMKLFRDILFSIASKAAF